MASLLIVADPAVVHHVSVFSGAPNTKIPPSYVRDSSSDYSEKFVMDNYQDIFENMEVRTIHQLETTGVV